MNHLVENMNNLIDPMFTIHSTPWIYFEINATTNWRHISGINKNANKSFNSWSTESCPGKMIIRQLTWSAAVTVAVCRTIRTRYLCVVFSVCVGLAIRTTAVPHLRHHLTDIHLPCFFSDGDQIRILCRPAPEGVVRLRIQLIARRTGKYARHEKVNSGHQVKAWDGLLLLRTWRYGTTVPVRSLV